jgi:alpha-D-xyloside xylohydrolase
LGQHQDGIYNYKGEQVYFFQNNTEVAVPFFISPKNYGILWDNYSLTQAGDLRQYRPLSALALQDAKGNSGWLTATYYNDKDKAEVFLTRAESNLEMEFLDDYEQKMPKGFDGSKGKVVYEGSISSAFTGEHKLRFIFGGYLKLWIDGQLQFDRWRESWNPAPQNVSIQLAKEKPLSIKIEWIPEGGVSYLAAKWLEPLDSDSKDLFSFASEAGQQVDYYFIHGKNMDDVIAGYRTLTGKAPIMPKWSMGFWQSRERYKTQQELMDVVKEYRKRKIPLDNIVLDWSYWKEDAWGSQEFDEARFPSPEKMIDSLHQLNTKIMISVWPKFYEGIEAYKNFEKNGWLYARNVHGKVSGN